MRRESYEISTCPVCGSRDAREIASQDDVREEVEALWAFHTRRLRPDTPPARLTDRVAFSQAPPLRVVRCTCGTVYRNPRERAHELLELYGGDAPEPAVLEGLLAAQRPAYDAQAERLTIVAGKPGTGLEVGSYVGGFLAAAADRGWRFAGLDVNPHVNAFARTHGFRVADGDLAAADPEPPVDAVAIWNCLDQLPEPRAALTQASRLVRPGGTLAVRVPNAAFYAGVREHLAGPLAAVARLLLAHNNLLSFPYRQAFTAASLGRLFDETGFEVVERYDDALVPTADEWTRHWAAVEEAIVKQAVRVAGRLGREGAWLELYGKRRR
jgi:SAM-dependent methyltransferase